ADEPVTPLRAGLQTLRRLTAACALPFAPLNEIHKKIAELRCAIRPEIWLFYQKSGQYGILVPLFIWNCAARQ
ncbi:hypothetical protein P9314_24815, partial [Paenibacillus validus]|uniref:hypothetical protein n=1 Tax=Paenibacillus validus TaxID=44253 RepID=UPI002E1B6A8A|nr:hypothetical protein [Paenibacillus validus]